MRVQRSWQKSTSFQDLPASLITQSSSTRVPLQPEILSFPSRSDLKYEQGDTTTKPNLAKRTSSTLQEPEYNRDDSSKFNKSTTPAKPVGAKRSLSRRDSMDENSSSNNHLKRSKSLKRSNSKSQFEDNLFIKNREVLKQRAADLIQNLLHDSYANRALTLIATNARRILQDETGSKMILRHTKLIKDTLMDENAKNIIRTCGEYFSESFISSEAPETTTELLKESLNYLSDKNRPARYESKTSFLNAIINSKVIREALTNFKDAFFTMVQQPDIDESIAKMTAFINKGLKWIG